MITMIGIVFSTPDGPTTTQVTAEPTAATGLFITPEIAGQEMTGRFLLTHGASGYRLPPHLGGGGMLSGAFAPEELHIARRVAQHLADTPIDWTAERETVMAQITTHSAAVTDAVRRGKLPPAETSDGDDRAGEPPAPYPSTEAQATADALARHLTLGLLTRTYAATDLVGEATPTNPDGMRRYYDNLHAMIAEYGLVFVLREVAKLDRDVADKLAREVWAAWDAGDSIGEFVWEWAVAYDLPARRRSSTRANRTRGRPRSCGRSPCG